MKRLLVVDDEQQILELLEFSLQRHDFEVSTAGSGLLALDLAATETFDLIILDVLMAPMDGFETAAHLKERLSPCPPIIFLSGLDGERYEQRGRELGELFLTKPFRPSQLVEAIWQTLEARRQS